MGNGHKRYPHLLLIGLALLSASSILACSMPAQSPTTAVPPSPKPPQASDNKTPIQSPPPAVLLTSGNWTRVTTFTGKDNQTTPTFHISGMEWRITWTANAEYPEYAVFNLFVYPAGKDNMYIERVSHSGSGSNAVYIYEGKRDYYLKIIAADYRSWTITIEELALKPGEALSPVQITYIHYRGKIYPPEPEKQICYERVEPDEYVEIKNLSDSPQDIRGWILKNESKTFPVFTFPPFFQSPYIPTTSISSTSPVASTSFPPESSEYPKPSILTPYQALRVYTDEIHPESGGFTFYYGAGDIWGNNKPEVAVLYNANKQEVSRRSYKVIAQ